jgi:transposase
MTSTQELITRVYNAENSTNHNFKEILRILYVDKKMNIRDIADEYSVGTGTVHRWLREHNISTRHMTFM